MPLGSAEAYPPTDTFFMGAPQSEEQSAPLEPPAEAPGSAEASLPTDMFFMGAPQSEEQSALAPAPSEVEVLPSLPSAGAQVLPATPSLPDSQLVPPAIGPPQTPQGAYLPGMNYTALAPMGAAAFPTPPFPGEIPPLFMTPTLPGPESHPVNPAPGPGISGQAATPPPQTPQGAYLPGLNTSANGPVGATIFPTPGSTAGTPLPFVTQPPASAYPTFASGPQPLNVAAAPQQQAQLPPQVPTGTLLPTVQYAIYPSPPRAQGPASGGLGESAEC